MNRRHARPARAAVFVFGVLGFNQAIAHADPVEPNVLNYAVVAAPVVCRTLNEDPTILGVAGLMQAVIVKTGLTAYQAGEVVTLSVINECPWHTALLNQIATDYAPQRLRSA
ncbi:hypothetical protein [Mycobacterium marseillense]|jgi:hypothetical protein|uniref:DUF732 domain-containing protein n=1 Tax=Mycobacterium marseillense TaxID=701042 RepID=A0AAC9YJX4_9MYCO|nr:hypothetical protein [Mycobacterium marseillense]ASW89903.1 hypothetical protein CKJ54_08425 [Mycobacterium marseillense]MCA2262387.1 hypothetical protein [Mycobacterium marseillense]MCV7404323.1 hypothetical protein [Mycobacterium marseillense]MDM3973673.1 hypothetical protein [Mycobacterium marseillense]OBJ76554.1 hypothetical protein A5626_16415 [Mycobacterium marseillense]